MTRYHLRYQTAPGTDPERLAAFCVAHGVEEVVLMFNAEELFAGHSIGEAEDEWFARVSRAAEVAREHGLTVSLNPWVTAGHADRGRLLPPGFAPMVSPAGEVSTSTASFACPRWRAWLAGHFARFAALGPRILWLEDDFRFHNHSPMTWGGGFEPEMLERFAALAGEKPARGELVAAITAPGVPHPWRALLQRTWREAQLETVAAVRDAVSAVDDSVKLGLMSSGLGVASTEGRDWGALFATVEAHRPHYAVYCDTPGRELARSITALELQRALRPEGVEAAPEVENWPHTHWTKSDTQTWSEMVTAQLSGADALLLSVFPFITGDPWRRPRVGRMLTASRPALDAAATAGPSTIGVGVPWWQTTAAHLRAGGELDDLQADPLRAGEYLLPYGIPVRAGCAPVTALFGTAAWGAPDASLRELLAGGLLLDGTAAAILTERGFGDLLGVQVEEVVPRSAAGPAPYAMERVTEDGALLSVDIQPALARLTAAPGARTWTEIVTPDGSLWGAGRVAAVNALGGRVVTLAAVRPEDLGRCDEGQRLAHRAVRFLGGGDLPLVTGGAHLLPQYALVGGRHRLAVVNGSADPARPSFTSAGEPTALLLAPLAEPVRVGVRREGERWTVDADLPHRGYLLITWD